ESRLLSMVCNKLYKLKFIKNNNLYFDSNIISEDRLFNLKCYINRPVIKYVDIYTYYYNDIVDSRSKTIDEKYYKELMGLSHELYKYIQLTEKKPSKNELLQLMIILDVNKLISRIIEASNNKYSKIRATVEDLNNDKVVAN